MDRLFPDKPHKKGGKSHFIASTKGKINCYDKAAIKQLADSLVNRKGPGVFT